MKRGKKMALLLAVLVVLVIGYEAIDRMETGASVNETAVSVPLWQEGKTVSALSWTQDGETVSFAKGESVWMKTDDASFPVKQTALDNLAEKLSALKATRELTNVPQMADYGLETPSFTVTAKDEDGEEIVFAVGDETPFADGYYMSVSGRESVYVVTSNLATTFNKSLTYLASMEDIPEVTDATRLTVGDTLDICLNEAGDEWIDRATGERLDQSEAASLISAAKSMAWSELTETNASQETLAECGLDEAQAITLTLYQGEEATLTLLLGSEDADGDFYARLPGSAMVYTIYGGDVEELLAANLDSLYLKTPISMTAEQLGEAVFAWEGGEKKLTAEDAEASTVQTILSQLSAIKGTQRVENGELNECVLSVSLTDAEGDAQTLNFYAYSVDSYLLTITETHGMLVDAQSVDTLIRMLKQKA